MLHEFFTTICPACNREFYVAAGDDICPHCYHSRRQNRVFMLIVLAIGSAFIGFAIGNAFIGFAAWLV